MNDISKVSEITVSDLVDYIRIPDPTQGDNNTLSTILTVAKKYVTEYTGRTPEEIDTFEDMILAVLVLCQDMWDNRTLYVDSTNANRVVESILDLHSINLLPTGEIK